MTQTEMADHARAMVRAVPVPVIADADTGYGGPLNVRRTVEEYAQAGVAALHLEDQESPKRCGQLAGVRLVSAREAVLRIAASRFPRAGKRARTCSLSAARTLSSRKAWSLLSTGSAATRDLGADLAFVDGVKTRKEAEGIARGLEGPKGHFAGGRHGRGQSVPFGIDGNGLLNRALCRYHALCRWCGHPRGPHLSVPRGNTGRPPQPDDLCRVLRKPSTSPVSRPSLTSMRTTPCIDDPAQTPSARPRAHSLVLFVSVILLLVSRTPLWARGKALPFAPKTKGAKQ